jgi:GNAT superfamily N-acetyltransferase
MRTRGIRTGGAGDAAQVARLHADSWRTAYAGIMPDWYLAGDVYGGRLAVWRQRLAEPVPGAVLLLAETAETAVPVDGFAYLVPTPDGRLLLDNLHARPGRTGAGTGSRLLARARAWAAAEHPGRPLYVEVLCANVRAAAFYERSGARLTDERTCRFPEGFELPEYEYTWPHPRPLQERE